MSRPFKQIKIEDIERLESFPYNLSLSQVAIKLGVHRDTIAARLKSKRRIVIYR